ncbi:MAG: hypothetical protein GY898_28830 [Proteobacteria bacterium]|nr:hypothetical protein [Pseudomonadota bacterium]
MDAVDFPGRDQAASLAVDLDGDGYLDLVDMHREVWSNPCGAGAWLTVDLVGPPGNTHGLGARLLVEAGGRTWLREMHTLRTYVQSATEFHVGLGAVEATARIELTWPDGLVQEAVAVPGRRRLTLVHPDAD